MEKEKIVLNNNEKALIIALRTKFRFGEVIILMRDGVPQIIKKAWISTELRDISLTIKKD